MCHSWRIEIMVHTYTQTLWVFHRCGIFQNKWEAKKETLTWCCQVKPSTHLQRINYFLIHMICILKTKSLHIRLQFQDNFEILDLPFLMVTTGWRQISTIPVHRTGTQWCFQHLIEPSDFDVWSLSKDELEGKEMMQSTGERKGKIQPKNTEKSKQEGKAFC